MNELEGLSHTEVPLPAVEALEQTIRQVLDLASERGATAAEAGLTLDQGLSVTVRLGDVETLEFHRDRGVGVTVYYGRRKGSASTSDLSERSLAETVEAACDIARYTHEDDCAGLAPAELMAREVPDLDLYHPWHIGPEAATTLALRCEQAARELDPRISNSEGATLSSHEGLRVYGNSHGFVGGYRSSRHSLSCAVVAAEDGRMERDYWYTVSRRPDALEAAEAVGERAAQRTLRRLGGRKIATCKAPVIFSAELASGLFRSFVAAVRGSNLYRRSSFLLDQLDHAVFPAFMHIHEQPHLPQALGSAPFDSEGVATRERDLVSEGILRGYVLDSYSACKLGTQTTGNAGGVHNLTIDSNGPGLDGLLREMDRGLLITELMGQGVNIVTGDYSRGCAGFWVENGEIQYPVEEITVAGNLRDMFRQILRVGSDVDLRGNIRTGSVLIESMTIAGD